MRRAPMSAVRPTVIELDFVLAVATNEVRATDSLGTFDSSQTKKRLGFALVFVPECAPPNGGQTKFWARLYLRPKNWFELFPEKGAHSGCSVFRFTTRA